MWVAMKMYMAVTLGISPDSCLHLKLAKPLSFLLYFMFSLQQNWIQKCGTGSAQQWDGRGLEGELAQKCAINSIKHFYKQEQMAGTHMKRST
jgi:hypothetical protein